MKTSEYTKLIQKILDEYNKTNSIKTILCKVEDSGLLTMIDWTLKCSTLDKDFLQYIFDFFTEIKPPFKTNNHCVYVGKTKIIHPILNTLNVDKTTKILGGLKQYNYTIEMSFMAFENATRITSYQYQIIY